jgi:group II intron reverse transcriptase/maturase
MKPYYIVGDAIHRVKMVSDTSGGASNLIDRSLSIENLTAAWEAVRKNGGAAGADRITIRRWQRDWEARLVELGAEVRARQYRPIPLRRFRIPKADGNFRDFGIPAVTDRVLQRAVLQVVDDILDPHFVPTSFGYRTGRGVRDAVACVARMYKRGLTVVIDADIDECFASIDHDLLRRFWARTVPDPTLMWLVDLWLAGMSRPGKPACGLSLGGVLSPLLANLYLHRMDVALYRAGWKSLVRYADDFCIFCPSVEDAQLALEATCAALARLKMRLEPQKTRITSFDEGFDYLGVHFEGSEYSYQTAGMTIRVKAPRVQMPIGWVPEGYEAWERST